MNNSQKKLEKGKSGESTVITNTKKRRGKYRITKVLVLYCLFILGFALLYSRMPARSFYHTTIQYEYSAINSDALVILDDLKNVLTQNIKNHIDEKKGIWTINYESISLSSLNIKDYPEKIIFNVFVRIAQKDSVVEIGQTGKVVLILENSFYLNNDYYFRYQCEGFETAKINLTKDVPEIAYLIGDSTLNKDIRLIKLSKSIYTKITNLGNGYKGFPNQISGNFIRILYFSLGIASTMTMGDILPITILARIMVIIQTIITLIFLGLIIDSIVEKIKGSIGK